MTDIATTLRECHAIVWRYRAELEPYWPTPTTEDALLFAFTELGEAVDAHLRSKPQYARNNARNLDVLDELADCALMVLTAVGPDGIDEAFFAYGYIGRDKWYHRHEWSIYAINMGELLYWSTHGDHLMEGNPLLLVVRIATHPGMDLPARLTARLERIKAKRMPQMEADHA